ncbi:hypothetical protein [Croceicoccus sp. YJ47]|uniref:hypothetical protein n=1 Tax=Croceicoccus sp. YJ47 TaxID=2798724 RepID=UPI0019246841|nr:hypothetical protein [Croceicoccus sp. YJ47]QQN75035.1 hypothetical protein JD971_04885 [Croceicoccus sp. YJ47]
MAKPIPHRDLHKKLATKPEGGVPCPVCLKVFEDTPGWCLHHDHLMNFARDAFKRLSVSLRPGERWDTLWNRHGEVFLDAVRFDPIYICAPCNSGDAGGKTIGWCGLPGRVYPASFSMNVAELNGMRGLPKGAAKRAKAQRIWELSNGRHIQDRKKMVRLAAGILRS